ncbi:MAG: hypothetical protein JXA18_07240 [Chitinispirillaceae bacterium]|nr:hypothetical protein [Chitinispirillaceae bacterium]
MKKALALTAGIPLFFHFCSPPLQSALHLDGLIFREHFSGLREDVPFQGSGKVFLCFNGERQSGWFDVRYTRDRSFSATFYSPLGTIIGSITAHNDSAKMLIRGKEYAFSPEQTLDSLSFPWSGGLRLSDLTALLCGRLMPSLTFPLRPPDELHSKGVRKTAVWREKNSEISAIFSRSLKKLKRIVIKYHPDDGQAYVLSYGSFFDGKARYLSFHVDDGNYFSIHYERLEKEPQGL